MNFIFCKLKKNKNMNVIFCKLKNMNVMVWPPQPQKKKLLLKTVYFNQCGWKGGHFTDVEGNDVERLYFRFKDSTEANGVMVPGTDSWGGSWCLPKRISHSLQMLRAMHQTYRPRESLDRHCLQSLHAILVKAACPDCPQLREIPALGNPRTTDPMMMMMVKFRHDGIRYNFILSNLKCDAQVSPVLYYFEIILKGVLELLQFKEYCSQVRGVLQFKERYNLMNVMVWPPQPQA